MTDNAPTTDRLVLGVVAGAVVGGLALPVAFSVFVDHRAPELSMLLLIWFVAALALLILLPAIHMPVWWGAERIGLRGAFGAVVSGAVSLVIMPLALNWLFFRDATPAASSNADLEGIAILAPIGALIGFVIWRVAKWEVAPR